MFDRAWSGRRGAVRWAVGIPVCVALALILSACPVLASSQTSPPKPPAPKPPVPKPLALTEADRAAIPALVQAYFTALNQRDLDGAVGFWAPLAPDVPQMLRSLPMIFERQNPSWTEVVVSDLVPRAPAVRARVSYVVTMRPAAAPPGRVDPGSPRRSVMTFVRGSAGWRILSEKPESQDIAERLVEAGQDPGLSLILAEEGERIDLAVVRGILGFAGAAGAQSDYPRAIRSYELAARLIESPSTTVTPFERQNQQVDMHLAQALTGLGQAYAYKPNPDVPRAIELLTRALAIHERTEHDGGRSDVLQALGNAYYAGGDYASALERYQHVLPVAAKLEDDHAIARTQLGIGNVQYLFGQYDLALAAYGTALDAYVRAGNRTDQPRALQGLGRVQVGLGDYVQARTHYGRALEMLRETTQKSDQAAVLIDIARVCFLQGQLTESRTHYDAARTLATEAGDPLNLGRADFGTGVLHVVQGEFGRAIERYTAAEGAFLRAKNQDSVGQALIARASARMEQNELAGALEDFTASLRTFELAKNREGIARAHLGLAMTYVRRREAKPALAAATRAFELAARAITADVQWQARLEAGRAWRLTGDEAKAKAAFEEAIQLLESTRLEASGDEEAQTPTQRAAPYVALVEWHVTRGDATQALITADAAKRRTIEDLLRPFSFRLTRGLAPERQAEERRLAGRRVALLKQLRKERDLAKPDAARLAMLEKDLARARADASAWHDAVAREAPAVLWQRGEARLASLEPLASALDDRTALVHFIVGDERTSVIVATRRAASSLPAADATGAVPASAAPSTPPAPAVPGAAAQGRVTSGPVAPGGVAPAAGAPAVASPPRGDLAQLDLFTFTVAATRQQLAEQVWRFTDGIAKRAETVNADGRALYDLLLAPARARLAGRTQLVIVPDDSLWTLPFEALMPDDARYLIQDAAVTSIPSCAAWLSRPATLAVTPAPSGSTTGVAANATDARADTSADTPARGTPLTNWPVTGEVSDVSPMQTLLTLPAGAAATDAAAGSATAADAGAVTIAAWELFGRDLTTDVIVLAGVTPKPERLRLDSGRLGATGLWWALQLAGAPRAILARRPIPPDVPTPTALPLPHPHDWAFWLTIGPPEPAESGS